MNNTTTIKKQLAYFCVSLIAVFFSSETIQAQSWTQEATFGGGGRQYSAYFAIGSKGYIGFGNNNQVNDLWEYDPATNQWTQKASIPEVGGRAEMNSFVIGNKAYVGLGLLTGVGTSNEWWEYDPATNAWTRIADYPGSWTRGPFTFAINGKGYVGSGSVYTGLWEYDPINDTWTQKADVPTGAQRYYGVGFGVGGKGYAGTGVIGSTAQQDFWEYDPIADSWAQKTDVPGGIRVNAVSFSSASKGYIVTGHSNTGTYYNDVEEYDPGTGNWTTKTAYAGAGRFAGAGFAIGCKIFIGVGTDAGFGMQQDFWQLQVASGATIGVTADTTVCPGSPIVLTATGGSTYSWSPNIALSDTTGATVTATPSAPVTYTVTSSSGGCSGSASVSIGIISGHSGVGNIGVEPDSVCPGGNSQLTNLAGSGTVQWQSSPDGISFVNLTGDTTSVFNAINIDTLTYYRLTQKGSCGTDTSHIVQVNVYSLAPPVISANDTIICSTDSAIVTAFGNYTSYLWNTGDTLSYTHATQAGDYWVTVTNPGGCAIVSGHQYVSVYPVPSVSIIVKGDTLTSFNSTSYQWFYQDTLIVGATLPIYIAGESGNYAVQIVDTNGCDELSNNTYISVTGLQNVTAYASLDIFPNPASSHIFVSGGAINNPVGLFITDVTGRQISVPVITGKGRFELDISTLPAGIYELTVFDKAKFVSNRIVKQ